MVWDVIFVCYYLASARPITSSSRVLMMVRYGYGISSDIRKRGSFEVCRYRIKCWVHFGVVINNIRVLQKYFFFSADIICLTFVFYSFWGFVAVNHYNYKSLKPFGFITILIGIFFCTKFVSYNFTWYPNIEPCGLFAFCLNFLVIPKVMQNFNA